MTARVAVALGLALVLVGCGDRDRPRLILTGRDAGPPPAPPPLDAAARPSWIGVVAPAESVDIAPRFEGVIAAVHVRAGDEVAAGAALADMDPAPLREEVRAAEAALRAATAALRAAEVDIEDTTRRVVSERAAVASGASPRQNLEEAELALKRARAAADRARGARAEEQARVETARNRRDDARLQAPFAGTVALRYRDPGATIAAGTPIVRLVGRGGLRLRFAVEPDRTREVPVATVVAARIDTLPDPVLVTVSHVSPAIDRASGLVIVEAELPATSGLRAGLPATVTLP